MKQFKFLLLLLLTPFITGCEVTTHTFLPNGQINFFGVDLSKYAKEDFLITPMDYKGKYITTGIYEVEIVPQVKVLNNGFIATPKHAKELIAPKGFEKLLLNGENGNYWILGVENVDMDKVISEAVKFAKGSGGNAIVLFKTYIKSKGSYFKGIPFEYNTKSVSGVVIKRLD